jgi:formate-dependent phosphoribosylglycinamide formyltransferase (GAR transformylase)
VENFDFNTLKSLIPVNDKGGYSATIAGSPCEILPGQYPETWSVTVAGKVIVTETDELDHAWNQAIAQARQIEFNICGPRQPQN